MMFTLPLVLNARCIVETGLSQGDSTRIWLKALSQLGGERKLHTFEICCNDSIMQATRQKIDANPDYKSRWVLHCEDSLKANWNEPIDILYLDADHSKQAVEKELAIFAPHVKGVILGHDSMLISGVKEGFETLLRADPKWKMINFTYTQGMVLLYRD